MASEAKIAVVTGSNKGIGLELVRQLAKAGVRTVLTARSEARGKEAQQTLKGEGLDVDFIRLDVADEHSIRAFAQALEEKYAKVDILVNNAGIMSDEDSEFNITNIPLEAVRNVLETNTIGPLMLTQTLVPLLKKSGQARVVNVSSGLGQLSEMEASYPAYSVSKTALNAVTKQFASALKSDGVTVNTICPGWVRTDMGGDNAERSTEQSVKGILPLLLDASEKRTGHFMRDAQDIDW